MHSTNPTPDHGAGGRRASRLHWRIFHSTAVLGLMLGAAMVWAVIWLRDHPGAPLSGWFRSVHLTDMGGLLKGALGVGVGIALTAVPVAMTLRKAAEDRENVDAQLGTLSFLRQVSFLGAISLIGFGSACLWFSISGGREASNASGAFGGSLVFAALISIVTTAPELIGGELGQERRASRVVHLRRAAQRLHPEPFNARSLVSQLAAVSLLAAIPLLVVSALWSDLRPERLGVYAFWALVVGVLLATLGAFHLASATYMFCTRDTGIAVGIVVVYSAFAFAMATIAAGLEPNVPPGARLAAGFSSTGTLLACVLPQFAGPGSRLRLGEISLPGGRPVAALAARHVRNEADRAEGIERGGVLRSRVRRWDRWITGAL